MSGGRSKKVRRVGWVMTSSEKIKNKQIKNGKKEPHQEKRPHLEDFFLQLVF